MKISVRALLLGSVLFLFGCASVLTVLSDWLPVVLQDFNSYAAIAAPGNTTITADAAAVSSAISDTLTAISTSQTAQGIAAKLAVFIAVIPKFETDVAALGTLSQSDKEYIAASAAVIDTAAVVYESELTGNAPTSAQLQNVSGPCYGVETDATGRTTAYVDCTGDSSEAIFASLDPVPQITNPAPKKTTTTAATKVKVTVKHAKLGNFKRQLNAIARRYGHSENQVPLTWREHLHIS